MALLFNDSSICRGSDPVATFPALNPARAPASKIHGGCYRRNPSTRRAPSGDDDRVLNILNPPRPCRGTFTLRHARPDTRPAQRSTGENIRIPMQRSVVSLKWKCPHSPCPHRRLTEPRSGPLGGTTPNLGSIPAIDPSLSFATFQAVFWPFRAPRKVPNRY